MRPGNQAHGSWACSVRLVVRSLLSVPPPLGRLMGYISPIKPYILVGIAGKSRHSAYRVENVAHPRVVHSERTGLGSLKQCLCSELTEVWQLLWLSLGLPVDRHVYDVQPLSPSQRSPQAFSVVRWKPVTVDTEAEFLFWTINQFHYHYFTFLPQLLIVDSSH